MIVLRIKVEVIISIHALREESDSVWTAAPPSRQNFNPRPPRGERLPNYALQHKEHQISIHALREESDFVAFAVRAARLVFQSTPSARRATPRASAKPPLSILFQSTPSARRATCSAADSPSI